MKNRLPRLKPYVGRRALYLESGTVCVVRVETAAYSEKKIEAVLTADPEVKLACELRRMLRVDQDPVEGWLDDCPFGERWEISLELETFYVDGDYWEGSPYLVIRMFFHEEYIRRFLARDVSWIEEFFDGDG